MAFSSKYGDGLSKDDLGTDDVTSKALRAAGNTCLMDAPTLDHSAYHSFFSAQGLKLCVFPKPR